MANTSITATTRRLNVGCGRNIRADYGYLGDWLTDDIELVVHQGYAHLSPADVMTHVRHSRNVVIEMVATLRALKPVREPLRELQNVPPVRLRFA